MGVHAKPAKPAPIQPPPAPPTPSRAADRRPFATRALAAIGYLSVWSGLYVVGAVACASQLTGVVVRPEALAGAFLLAVSTYLLDRVKPAERFRDPADLAANPDRYMFMTRWATPVRAAMIAAWALSAWLLWRVHPLGALLPVASFAGVLLYTWRLRRGRRPKDILLLKNAAVALSVTGLALALVALGSANAETVRLKAASLAPLALAGVFLAGRVFADAAICDIPDCAGDRLHATRTFPVVLGDRATWRIVRLVDVALVLLLAGAAGARLIDWAAGAVWALGPPLTTPLLRRAPRSVLRDTVDGRLFVLAVCAAMLAH